MANDRKDSPTGAHPAVGTGSVGTLDQRTVQQLLSLQEKELGIRQAELARDEAKDKRNFEYAQKALEAKTQLQNEDRKTGERVVKWVIVSGGLTFFGLATLVCILVSQGQQELVKQAMYYATALFGGGASGYSIRMFQTQKSE